MSYDSLFDFEIEIIIEVLTIKNLEQVELKDTKIELNFLGNKIEDEDPESLLLLTNGCHDVDLKFILKNKSETPKEEFLFCAFGNLLIINFVGISSENETKSKKNLKETNVSSVKYTTGSINLIHVLQRRQSFGIEIFHSELESSENFNLELCVQYRIKFVSPPTFPSSLGVENLHFLNWTTEEDPNSVEVAFHFPGEDLKFKPVFMHKYQVKNGFDLGNLLISDSLENVEYEFQFDEKKTCYGYENFLSSSSFSFLTDVIRNNENLLVEIRWNKKLYMSIINLDVFNYEGVHEMKFLLPIYHRHEDTIENLFHQEMKGFSEDEKLDKKNKCRKSSKVIKEEESKSSDLIPFMIKDNHVMMVLNLKIAQPLVEERSVKDLKFILNHKVPFIEEVSPRNQIVSSNEADFKKVVRHIANRIERVINKNANLDTYQIRMKVKMMVEKGELFDKQELKEVLKSLIGNKINLEKKTETNHEFKISMISAFKILSREMMKILDEKVLESDLVKQNPFPHVLRRGQTEEWLQMGLTVEAENGFRKDLDSGATPELLIDFVIFLIRAEKYVEAEKLVIRLLKIDSDSNLGFYFLAYLKVQSGDIDASINCLQILVKLQPNNKEYWIILKMLYTKINFQCGVSYCKIRICSSKSLLDATDLQSMIYPEVKSLDELVNILNRQLKRGLINFADFTKEYMSANTSKIEDLFNESKLLIIEKMMKGQLDDAMTLLKTLEINDDNEASLRILKGSLHYAAGRFWQAICEYEIAYNLCLKNDEWFPQHPAMHCAYWYLNEAENLAKARRYFHHCCKSYPTFKSWMGLGIVCYNEMDYVESEKYFKEANKIYKKDGDNWIYLALTNFHLRRMETFKKCFSISREFCIGNSELLEEAEKLMNL